MSVAAEPALAAPASADQIGPRVELLRHEPGADERRQREDDHVVGEERREQPGHRDQHAEHDPRVARRRG